MSNPRLEQVKQEVSEHSVLLYMKGTPAFPQCGFSATICQILSHLDCDYHHINTLIDPGLRDAVKQFADWPAIPMLFMDGEFIGGADIVRDLYDSGELQDRLNSIGFGLKKSHIAK
jgi:monothiol glutaredoxin